MHEFKAMDLIMDLDCLMSEGNQISLGKKEINLRLCGLIVYLKQWTITPNDSVCET